MKNFGERYHIAAKFTNAIENLEIDSQKSIALFRIIQEALNNVAKHAHATSVKIELILIENKLVLTIVDNGIGIDENTSRKTESYGLIGMNERVFLLGGELYIKGKKNVGTIIKVEMPFEN